MATKKRLRYRELRAVLKRYAISENKQRGKGSHRMFEGVVDGRVVRYPTRCHSESEEKPVPVIEAIRRAFGLTSERGVSDEDFYGK